MAEGAKGGNESEEAPPPWGFLVNADSKGLCFETAESRRVTGRFAEVRILKGIAANHGVAWRHVFGASSAEVWEELRLRISCVIVTQNNMNVNS